MRSESQIVTLECAGNGRSMLSPATEGEQWTLGAVSTAEWTGVPLIEVLNRAGIGSGAREVLFRGADHGGTTYFERSLTLEAVRDSHPLLAYAMNGKPLPDRHGYPLRVIVPGWYGMASVKWLAAIELMENAFAGYFQTDKYVYEWERNGRVVREPVTITRVRAVITEPGADEELGAGNMAIRGVAWSGAAPIACVEVSTGHRPGRPHPARAAGMESPRLWSERHS
jgi:DMSO/TMAO reductase YedYZ molybdopterin-dependent catalytic subunit